MQIPKRFRLLGQVVEVRFDERLIYTHDNRGEVRIRENVIVLQSDGPQYPILESQSEQTFLHELVHVILDRMGETELSANEKFVDMFAGMLHQALITSEYEDQPKGKKPR